MISLYLLYLHRRLHYPFSIPVGSSYACRTDESSTTHIISNPNRFVQIGNSTGDDDIIANVGEGGPVVQFTGLHVRKSHYITKSPACHVLQALYTPCGSCGLAYLLRSFSLHPMPVLVCLAPGASIWAFLHAQWHTCVQHSLGLPQLLHPAIADGRV